MISGIRQEQLIIPNEAETLERQPISTCRASGPMSVDKFRQLADRIARMDRAELRFRLHQELDKRQDGLLWLLKHDFARHAQTGAGTQRGHFFFSSLEVNDRVRLLQQRIPDQADRILQQAERILQHRFDLLGYSGLEYGRPIDWHLDLVHGKRAPRKLFHRVRYLDFTEVGDSKVTWELNRHQHFVTLAKAYRLTGNMRYPDEILRQWRHWWEENPYPVGMNWASSLEVGFRSLSWLWTYHLLEGAPGIPDFRAEWMRGLALHGRHIERYLSTYFSPNTHLLGEGAALFFLGVLCPELDGADRWRQTGWQIVLEGARRQVQADGFHFEQSTYYHVYALDFFLHAAILAMVNGIELPADFEATLEKMLSALSLLGRVGSPPRFGDDDGGRLFDSRRNRAEHLLDPLATGAILFNRGEFKALAQRLREETIWLLGPEGVKQWDELETQPVDRSSAALGTAGFYVMPCAQPSVQLVMDCGPLGTQSGGHGHADALSLTLHARGAELLIDPGTCEYAGERDDRRLFRGTAMHNTVRVDGVDQAEPATAFSWSRLTQSKADEWIQGKHFDLMVGSHDGYERLPSPVRHRRTVLSLRNGIYLVRDLITGQGQHLMEVFWRFGQDVQLVKDGLYRVRGASNGFALLPVEGHGWAEQVSKQPWSPAYGQKSSASVLTFSITGPVPREFCTLLVTLDEALDVPGKFTRIASQPQDSGATGYRFVGNEDCSFVFGESGKNWRHGSVSSDAEFVCWIQSREGLGRRLILVNGTHATVEAGPTLKFKRRVSWGELDIDNDNRQVFSSDPEAILEEPAPALSLRVESESEGTP